MGVKTPTARTVDQLRANGFAVAVVEHWNPFARVKNDLFGVFDVLALSPEGETWGVQCTSRSNVSSRVKKITDSQHLSAIRKCGWRVIVHGWDRGPDNKYRVRAVDLS